MRNIRNCKVVVAGGAGFLGSHLVDYLIEERNCEVLVLDNLISGKEKFINRKAEFIHFDITGSESELRQILEGVDYVFNYVAEPYIPVSFKRPLHVFNTNAFGALKLINAAHEAGVKGILQVSSAEIYGNVDGKIKEDAKTEPHSSYGASKLAIDSLVQCGWKERGVPAIAMRQFNCYGPRETHEYVIPVIIEQLAESKDVKLGNNSSRDFQYCKDAVRMAVELLEKGQFGEVYNMGSENTIKMYDLAKTIGGLMGHEEVNVITDPERIRPWEIWHLQSDNEKLYSVIDGRPETSFEDGLKETIKDYQENGWAYVRI